MSVAQLLECVCIAYQLGLSKEERRCVNASNEYLPVCRPAAQDGQQARLFAKVARIHPLGPMPPNGSPSADLNVCEHYSTYSA